MIYPVDQQIAEFLAGITDPETGEISEFVTEEMISEKLEKIKMEFDDKIVELRNAYIDSNATAEALKAEKIKLEKRQKVEESNAKRIKNFIGYLLHGEKFAKGTCKISYRKTEEVALDDQFVEWAKEHADEYLRYKDPEPKKDDIKSAIKNGMQFEHAEIKQKVSVLIK